MKRIPHKGYVLEAVESNPLACSQYLLLFKTVPMCIN